jgi:hypothetical protein
VEIILLLGMVLIENHSLNPKYYRRYIMGKKKKKGPSPFPRGKPIPPGKSHPSKKDYDRRIHKQIEIPDKTEED